MFKNVFPLVAALLGGLLFAPAPARADVQNIATSAPMVRVGVDHQVAAAHGYEIRTDDRGVEYAARPGTPQTEGYKDGVCGRSWVDFTEIDPAKHTSRIVTGFTLLPGYAGAVFVRWNVSVIDDYGVTVRQWSRPATSKHRWDKSFQFQASGPTWAYADVNLGSIATLWDGTVCYSHGPRDRKWL